MGELTQDALDRAMARLAAMYSEMPEDEREVVQTILRQAVGEREVEGFMAATPDLPVGKIIAPPIAPPTGGRLKGGELGFEQWILAT